MTTADASMPPPAGAVNFLGKEGAYWRLRIKGAALLVLTLGIYRFWFATDVRRYLWSNTEIGGETLEYTGLATELLGGFLIAVTIVGPLYTAIATAALALETADGGDCGRRLFAPGAAQPVRALPGAPLPADPYGIARRALRSARLGLALRAVCAAVLDACRRDARARLSVGAGEPATLQDAPHQLWRSARFVCRLGMGAVLARAADLARCRRAGRGGRYRARPPGRLECAQRDDGAGRYQAAGVARRQYRA